LARASQSDFIWRAFSGVRVWMACIKLSTEAHSGIRIHVFQLIILSFSHPSFTHIHGFPADILSTGLIQKSSLTGI